MPSGQVKRSDSMLQGVDGRIRSNSTRMSIGVQIRFTDEYTSSHPSLAYPRLRIDIDA